MSEETKKAIELAIRAHVMETSSEAFLLNWGVIYEYTSVDLNQQGSNMLCTLVGEDQAYSTNRGLFSAAGDKFVMRAS